MAGTLGTPTSFARLWTGGSVRILRLDGHQRGAGQRRRRKPNDHRRPAGKGWAARVGVVTCGDGGRSRAPMAGANLHKAAAARTGQTAGPWTRLSARHSGVRSVSAPIAAPAAAVTSAAISVLRNAGRRRARTRLRPIAAVAIAACSRVDAVAPDAAAGTIATTGTSHQAGDS